MDPYIVILSKVSQTDIIWYCLCLDLKKMIEMNLFTKQKQTHIENKHGYQRWKQGGGINWKFGIAMYTLLYIKIDNQQKPTI